MQKGHEWLSFMTFLFLLKYFEELWEKQNQYSSAKTVGRSLLSGLADAHKVANGIH